MQFLAPLIVLGRNNKSSSCGVYLMKTIVRRSSLPLSGDCSKLAVNQYQVGGLIVCYRYHAEFIGPGAIAYSPLESSYTEIFSLGNPILLPLDDEAAVQAAYKKRLQWVTWLARITQIQDSAIRSRRLIQGLEGLFSPQAVARVSDSALALLIGVLPQTMKAVREEHQRTSLLPVNEKQTQTDDRRAKPVLTAVRTQSVASLLPGLAGRSPLSANPKYGPRRLVAESPAVKHPSHFPNVPASLPTA